MQTPLQFFPPEKYRNLVVVSHLTPEDFPYPIYFASSVLQQWGANKDNYILEQQYMRDLVGLSLVTICVKERTRIAIVCNKEFNSVQSTLSGNCIAYLQGYGFMLLVSRTYTFQYIPEGSHEIWLEPNVYHFLYILLSDAQLKELGIAHSQLGQLIDKALRASKNGTVLDRGITGSSILRLLVQMQEQHIGYKAAGEASLSLRVQQLMLSFMMVYERYLRNKEAQKNPTSAQKKTFLIKAYITDHITDHTSTSYNALAARFSTTEKTIIRNWEKEFGDTPYEFMNELRMMLALYMLIRNKTPVNEVAETLGYQNAGSLTRSFTSHFGFQPKEAAAKSGFVY